MVALLIAGAVSLAVPLLGMPLFMRLLATRGIGQPIQEDGPETHLVKQGTPTMGGVMIVAGGALGYMAAHIRSGTIFTWGGLLTIGVVVAAGFVGFLDDFIKVKNQRNLGLRARTKMIGLLIVGLTFAVLAIRLADVHTTLSFTSWDSPGIGLGRVGWCVLAVFMIAATTNGVNLADGDDGLAAGSAALSFSAFVVIGFWEFRHVEYYQIPQALDLALIAAAMLGACTGFLWWNAAPAKIIMGDVGALAIGAGLAALALVTSTQLLLPIIGALYVVETLSVVIQVTGYKLTRQTDVPHGADPLPLRTGRLARNPRHHPAVDRRGDVYRTGAGHLLRHVHHERRHRLMRYLVAGLGRTGASVVRMARSDGADVMGYDDNEDVATRVSSELDLAAGSTGAFVDSVLGDVDEVVVSPGFPFRHPVRAAAAARGVRVVGDVEAGCRAYRHADPRRNRHQRQEHRDPAHHRDAQRRRAQSRRGRQRRLSDSRRHQRSGRLLRSRGVELPTRRHRRVPSDRRRVDQPVA